ncbi:MAG: Phosphoribosyltransferase [Candidatus Yanofskybacteria bacterium GW2011_GWF1_44_227]|uniref:Phosphoribosyltransferase n=1 Tax=Candidatus Yanofskybacteria bacterium GW2011_GWE2_40_11 TaxID=1619033 RepID=A0A0G0QTM8_9BACT|nr:MAG: Phosphoribosyltransferase [Candidatus Yanofskybacteria bacterium GW2011_GWE1_40_10]KKR40676.1 MAG: Phosphoribosyltransferase [Candidatus Yanofskybacteria bacterium GW2011_GWE2_40_11]KKT15763.1 MAG: Phosphoribosyltransferase [Candidatus Yanofskybacteria bacterium GW2011_GWF2_43_596]KKT53453.1 MAG: Phosphoribosyltransferase [Candidatus Yanofskybacteria bacterium GW2011_GWF1_44_227]OGN35862.1 MAG: hypothetical protein A2241_03725 [Candidatus Yanofskybacteria bacterium RIFOXYA2_FULL_45_28]
MSDIKINRSFKCIGCKLAVIDGEACWLCRDSVYIDRLFVATEYKDKLIQRSVKYFKYSFIKELSGPLSVLLIKYLGLLGKERKINLFDQSTIVMPVPLSRRRFNWRGFNQAELLAKSIADNFLMPMEVDTIRRREGSVLQASVKDRSVRLENVLNIFEAKDLKYAKGARVILVDDVVTSGATMNECAKVLKENGAREVFGLAIARG